jgi:uncharacterized damage-inducible protein DinB
MKQMTGSDQRIRLLLELIDQAYERQAWHGPNLKGSLRGVSVQEAAWRPGPGRHSIRDIALHAAYWKYTVRRRLTGEKRGSFPVEGTLRRARNPARRLGGVSGSNWFPQPSALTGKEWKETRDLLEEMHRTLRAAIEIMPPGRLDEFSGGTRHTHARLIYGIASHDLYHAGQIQLIKRLGAQKK